MRPASSRNLPNTEPTEPTPEPVLEDSEPITGPPPDATPAPDPAVQAADPAQPDPEPTIPELLDRIQQALVAGNGGNVTISYVASDGIWLCRMILGGADENGVLPELDPVYGSGFILLEALTDLLVTLEASQ